MLRYLYLLPLLLTACSDQPPTTPETRAVEHPNAGNTAIYDVDADDPYEIGDGSFMDMKPGAELSRFASVLVPGRRSNGEGSFDVHYIRGRRQDTLGYVFSDDGQTIERIIIDSPDAVTQDGIRVGNTFGELRERMGKLEIYGSEVESRVYAKLDPFLYRLAANAAAGTVDEGSLDTATPIVEIIIE